MLNDYQNLVGKATLQEVKYNDSPACLSIKYTDLRDEPPLSDHGSLRLTDINYLHKITAALNGRFYVSRTPPEFNQVSS